MRFGSVCSGIEAASVAWHPLGWEPVFFAQHDPEHDYRRGPDFPSAVLAQHYPKVPNLGDITKFQEWPDYAIDLLVGGTPCQSFSVSGLREGLADPRGNLCLTFLAIADRYRPEWILWENVPGVLSSNGGRDFGSFLGSLGQLGYGWSYRVLDAQYVRAPGFARAVPQRRRRVFVVGHLGDWRRAAAVLFERESLLGNPPPSRRASQRIAGTLAGGARTGGGYSLDDLPIAASLLASDGGVSGKDDVDGRLVVSTLDASYGRLQGASGQDLNHGHSHLVPVAFGGNNTAGPIEVAPSLLSHGGPCGHMDFESETFVATAAPPLTSNPFGDHESREGLLVAHALRAEGFDASEDGTGRGTPIVPVRAHAFDARQSDTDASSIAVAFDTTQITSPTNRSQPRPGEPCHPLTAEGHAPAIAFSYKDHGADASREVSPTLRAAGHAESHANAGAPPAVLQGWRVRRLMPIECERLQAFPDGYTAIRYRGKPATDGHRYKALGNSMAVNVMRYLGMRFDLVRRLAGEADA